MYTELSDQYNYRFEKGCELVRLDDQVFPDGKEIDLNLEFGENIARIPLQATITGSNLIKASLTLSIDDLDMMGLYYNILDRNKRTDDKVRIRWKCKEVPQLREITLAWNGVMLVARSRTHEEYADLENLLNPGDEKLYTDKWKSITVPDQDISCLTLILDEPIKLKPEYKLRYIIPSNESYLRGVPIDLEKMKQYLESENEEDEPEVKTLRKRLSRLSIDKKNSTSPKRTNTTRTKQ